MSEKKFVTIVHNALANAAEVDAELKKLGFATSFKRDGKEVTFPTNPIRLYFKEADGEVNALRNQYVEVMENAWKKIGVKSGVASVLVGDDWRA